MHEIQQIKTLIANRDIKRADIVIARLLRLDLTPSELRSLYMLRARTRLLSGRPEDAIDDLTFSQKLGQENDDTDLDLLELFGDAYFARFELASVGFADRTDALRAQQAYERLITLDPDYSNLGWIYYQQGRIQLTQTNIAVAEGYFQKALLSASHVRALSAFCYERLGFIAFYETRDLPKSLTFLERAINTYPHDEDGHWLVQVHILRSRVFKTIGDTDSALRVAEAGLKIASGSQIEKRSLSEAILNITELLSGLQGHDRETLAYLDQFTQQTKRPPGADVTWSRVYEMRGNAHFALGKFDDAISDYTAALQFNPDHPWESFLYQQIARALYQKRSYSEAIEILNKLLNTAHDDGHLIVDFRVYDLLGNAFFALKRYTEAIQAYQSALLIVPPNTDSRNKIQSYYDLAKELI